MKKIKWSAIIFVLIFLSCSKNSDSGSEEKSTSPTIDQTKAASVLRLGA